MKIVFIGDSWTNNFKIDLYNSYPYLIKSKLNVDINVVARDGANNFEILHNSLYFIKNKLTDIIVIGWSGISRTYYKDSIEYNISNLDYYTLLKLKDVDTNYSLFPKKTFSLVTDFSRSISNEKIKKQFFKTHNLKYFQQKWDTELKLIEDLCLQHNIKLIHFSVFGDKPINKYPNFLDISFLEYLAKDQIGTSLKYEIPIFEFGFFEPVVEEFCDRNLDSNWRLACLEREELRLDQPKKNFLNCGHPNENGHKIWADFLCEKILNKNG
jgi:hypothetical protein